MIEELVPEAATKWFHRLPPVRQIATLSPAYVCADAARDSALNPVFLLFTDHRGFWLNGVHLSAIPGTDYFDIQSPYGYGGPVTDCDDTSFLAEAWTEYCAWCARHSVIVEFVRLHPMAPWQRYAGEVVNDRETVAIDLKTGRYRDRYEVRCRTAVRRAEKFGVTASVHTSAAIASRFAPFYRDGMERVGAKSFFLFGDSYFSALARMASARLVVCEHDGEWVSAGIFLKGASGLEYHLSATAEGGRLVSATNLLIDTAAQLAEQEGLEWLYLGGGTDASVDNPLLKFKAGFSPLRQTYCHGFHLHDPASYMSLRERLSAQNARVLFYR